MAGNSKRKGAIRTSKKGATAGSGGRGKQNSKVAVLRLRQLSAISTRLQSGLRAAERAAEKRGSTRVSRPRDRDGIEWVAGRNSVLEALRANIPANALYMQQFHGC
jgi:23S rRNA (guanosine2251-2'-O)-methyltransferase